PMALRGMLRDIGYRAAVFAANGQPLQHPQGYEDDRRRDPDGRKVRQHTECERREAHQHDGDQEGVLAPDQIADAAENDRTEGPDGEAGGEAEQGEDEGRRGIDAREEMLADLRRQSADEEKVVP